MEDDQSLRLDIDEELVFKIIWVIDIDGTFDMTRIIFVLEPAINDILVLEVGRKATGNNCIHGIHRYMSNLAL
jgi:hypothetical protein